MTIELQINYSNASEKFILKNKRLISFKQIRILIEKSIKRINNYDTNIDIKALKGNLKGFYRIRRGDLRIIFKYYKGEIHIVNIEKIDFRGNVY